MVTEQFLHLAREAKARIKQVDTPQAKTLIEDGALLLDVREPDEFEQGHLRGATHICSGSLAAEINGLAPDKTKPIVCYCGGGNRGAIAADALQSLGYTNVVSIEGGLKAFHAALQKEATVPETAGKHAANLSPI